MSHDIHNYSNRMKLILNKIKKEEDISKRNKKILEKFYERCVSEGLSPARITRCLYALRTFSKWLEKDFDKCKKDDIVSLVARLEESHYAHSTKQEMKATLRKFFKIIKDSEDYPKEVKWIKCQRKLNNRKLPEELLTDEDAKLLINCSDNKRDKAIIAILFESGCRIGELLSLKMKNIRNAEHGCILTVDGKTGMRRVRIITSSIYLTDWVNEHPLKGNPESPVWILEKKKKMMKYNDVKRMIRKLKKNSGIKKRINPHNFRHSRATIIANHFTGAQMKEYLGWTQSSKMASVYIHMSGRDVDDALLKMHGIKEEEKTNQTSFKIKECIRCKESNPPTNKFCKKCGMVLDEKDIINIAERNVERRKADDVMDKLIEDPQFKEMFLDKIKQLLISKN